MLGRLFRALYLRRLNRDLDQVLAYRRMVRSARSSAAKKGQSSEWKRRGAQCRKVFGA